MTSTERTGTGLAGLPDEQLIVHVAHGNIDAFGVLYDRFSARAYSLAWSVCRERGRAEDAVQEAFISIWRNRSTYDAGAGSLRAWLFGVVRHRAIDVARRQKRHDLRRLDARHALSLAAADDIAGQTIAQSEARRMQQSLARLPAAQREVIALAFYGQMSHTEIAKHLGLPPGTVKGRMRTGLTQLRGDAHDVA